MGSKSLFEDLTPEDLKRLQEANDNLKKVIEEIYEISGGKLVNIYQQQKKDEAVIVNFDKKEMKDVGYSELLPSKSS